METSEASPAEAYAAALDHLAAVRRRADAYEPRRNARTPADEAAYAALDARRSCETGCGQAAARACEAESELRDVRLLLDQARAASESGARVRTIPGLEQREKTAIVRAEELVEAARVETGAMQARVGLEVEQRELLDLLRVALADASRRVAAALAAAGPVLAELTDAENGYDAVLDDVREQLLAAGFDESWNFAGVPHPTSPGTSSRPLRLAGVPWPSTISPVSPATLIADLGALAEAVRPILEREDGTGPADADEPPPVLETEHVDA